VAEEESYVVKARDLDLIIRSQNEKALEELIKDPLSTIAAVITEYLSHGAGALLSPVVRIAHGALKGKLLQQFAVEIQDLRRKGKLPEGFANQKYGYDTWVDLLKIIDDEAPDEDRLEALKAMFFAANKYNTTDGEKIVAYQLFQLAKDLSSNELLVLNALWRLYNEGQTMIDVHTFRALAQRLLGHSVTGLIDIGYRGLTEHGLASGYALTDLGREFCANVQSYRAETKSN
jgi:hypothetical protein